MAALQPEAQVEQGLQGVGLPDGVLNGHTASSMLEFFRSHPKSALNGRILP